MAYADPNPKKKKWWVSKSQKNDPNFVEFDYQKGKALSDQIQELENAKAKNAYISGIPATTYSGLVGTGQIVPGNKNINAPILTTINGLMTGNSVYISPQGQWLDRNTWYTDPKLIPICEFFYKIASIQDTVVLTANF